MRCAIVILLGILAVAWQPPAAADGFAALVSPPRFELSARPGETVRQVFQLTNRSTALARYWIHSADWSLTPDFGVNFAEGLQESSCRPWVGLERPEATLTGGATLRYRFEVAVPADAVVGECRFGMLIESREPFVADPDGLRLPIAGRIGVIVYVKVGNAAPELEILGPTIRHLNGHELPTLRVHNSGTAHGRMAGFLSGEDAKGGRYDFNPSDFPILPGETADVYLVPATAADDHPILAFPVHVHGTLEWGDHKTALDERFE
jgi:hypothetical protein